MTSSEGSFDRVLITKICLCPGPTSLYIYLYMPPWEKLDPCVNTVKAIGISLLKRQLLNQ